MVRKVSSLQLLISFFCVNINQNVYANTTNCGSGLFSFPTHREEQSTVLPSLKNPRSFIVTKIDAKDPQLKTLEFVLDGGKTIQLVVDAQLVDSQLFKGSEPIVESYGNPIQKLDVDVDSGFTTLRNDKGKVVALVDFRPIPPSNDINALSREYWARYLDPKKIGQELALKRTENLLETKSQLEKAGETATDSFSDIKNFLQEHAIQIIDPAELRKRIIIFIAKVLDPSYGIPAVTEVVEPQPEPSFVFGTNYLGNMINALEKAKQESNFSDGKITLDMVEGFIEELSRGPRGNVSPFLDPKSISAKAKLGLGTIDWADKFYFVTSVEEALRVYTDLCMNDSATGELRLDQNVSGIFFIVDQATQKKLYDNDGSLPQEEYANYFINNSNNGGFFFDGGSLDRARNTYTLGMHKMSPETLRRYINAQELQRLTVNGVPILYSKGLRFPPFLGVFEYRDYRGVKKTDNPYYMYRSLAEKFIKMGLVFKINTLSPTEAINYLVTQQHEHGVGTRYATDEKAVDDLDGNTGRIMTISQGVYSKFQKAAEEGRLVTFEAWHMLPTGKLQLVGFNIGERNERDGRLITTESFFYEKFKYMRPRGGAARNLIELYNSDAITIMRVLKFLAIEELHQLGIDLQNVGMVTKNSDEAGAKYRPRREVVPQFWKLAYGDPVKLPNEPNVLELIEVSKSEDPKYLKKDVKENQAPNTPLGSWTSKLKTAQELYGMGFSVVLNPKEITPRTLQNTLIEERWNEHGDVFETIPRDYGFFSVAVYHDFIDTNGNVQRRLAVILAGYGTENGAYTLRSFYDQDNYGKYLFVKNKPNSNEDDPLRNSSITGENESPRKLASLSVWALADRLHDLGIKYEVQKDNSIYISQLSRNVLATPRLNGKWEIPEK